MKLPSLAGHPFLDAPALKRVMHALKSDEGATRIVGGAVRNALLSEPVGDIDMATVLLPEDVVAAAGDAGLKSVPTGIEHGTVTVIAEGHPFEVTTLRADVETDGRHAVVRFTDDWAEDAGRRDFTLNALYCDASGHVFDPLGGYADLDARNIRFVGDPEERIREDYLRILRFFRFFAWYGDGRPDAEGLKACSRLKAGIAVLSAERVWSELKRLLAAPDPSRALRWMRITGTLDKALPENWGIDAIERVVVAERTEEIPPDPLLRLMAIIPPHRSRIDQLSSRLRLARKETERLVSWAETPEPESVLSEALLARRAYSAGRRALTDRLFLALARDMEKGDESAAAARRRQLAFLRDYERPTFPLTGKDLLAAGYQPGPELGKLLNELEERWLELDFAISREELLALARRQ
ncbi:tRNA nucleotidyltransferase/poly(A) polymerase [Rhodopseudomonas julia]|uniref:tRNA nucleotidyltransferase/poly(A) polymerase n=1 Tax=Rhodopseudomonas julia TaxID=200617 RepID=A0ABU0CAM5_9BRAD|nr:CCA tRNA nucleotidyltransferase [Rhodopseudomonas julia]MDQ0327529.1 tRNA nucleotidyltransferase/poly(A) polymerase [Rhodopseudomonas julia]